MKHLLLGALISAVAANGFASSESDTAFSLEAYQRSFATIQRAGMFVLGSWAIANFAVNGVALPLIGPDAAALQSFLIMNIGWNLVNAGLAGAGLLSRPAADTTLAGIVKRQYRIEKTFLFNAGLDTGYMAFGLFLISQASGSVRGDMLEGFGYALILQGAALFGFDLAMQIIHARNRRALDRYLESIP